MFERILAPIDGSEPSTKALRVALQMATSAGDHARVRLIYVLEEFTLFSGYDARGAGTDDLADLMRENGTKLLDRALAMAKAAAVDAECQLLEPRGERLGETVAKAASAWKADVVVVGTHGRHGPGRMFLGSGAEQIIRLAPVPVLVVRSPADATGTSEQAAAPGPAHAA
jgi:nucleotide-binding universal stress UspA family protein